MARVSKEDREKRDASILASFHTGGFSNRDLAIEHEVSPATVNKLTKGLTPKNKNIVNVLVSAKAELSSQTKQEVNAVNTLVNEKTKHLIYFQESALRNQAIANQSIGAVENMIKEAADDKEKNGIAINSIGLLKDHATVTKMNKETVLGKDAETQVNIQTNVQQITNIDDFYESN